MEDFERPKTRIQWMLGNNCNYDCSYCLDLFKRGDYSAPDEELFLEICKDIIYHYDDLGNDVVFEFIGGEPTLTEKIPDIGQRLHNYPTSIILRTNGSASLDWWLKSSRYLSEVIISVHREFADIEHIINVIKLLKESKNMHPIEVKVLFPVTVRPESWNWGISHVKKFRKRFGVGELQLLYSNFGRKSDTLLPYKEEQLNQIGKSSIVTNQSSVKTDPFNYKGKTCYAGIDTLVIDAIGDIFRGWCLQEGKIGNIYKMPVAWPKTTIICQKESCKNGFDQSAKKI